MIEGLKCIGDILAGPPSSYVEARDCLIEITPWSDLAKCVPIILDKGQLVKMNEGYPVYEEIGKNIILEFILMKHGDDATITVNQYHRLSPIAAELIHRHDCLPDGSVDEYNITNGEAVLTVHHQPDDKMECNPLTRFIIDSVLVHFGIEWS